MNSAKAERFEQQIATGEALLKRVISRRVWAWVALGIGIVLTVISGGKIHISWGLAMLWGGYTVYRTNKQIREIEDGLIEYQSKRQL